VGCDSAVLIDVQGPEAQRMNRFLHRGDHEVKWSPVSHPAGSLGQGAGEEKTVGVGHFWGGHGKSPGW
jgi:hypothetical protein